MPHTPGPWEIDEDDIHYEGVHVATVRMRDNDSFDADLAANIRLECQANARLIAAAPALLAACRAALMQTSGEVYTALHAAIAQAEGGGRHDCGQER